MQSTVCRNHEAVECHFTQSWDRALSMALLSPRPPGRRFHFTTKGQLRTQMRDTQQSGPTGTPWKYLTSSWTRLRPLALLGTSFPTGAKPQVAFDQDPSLDTPRFAPTTSYLVHHLLGHFHEGIWTGHRKTGFTFLYNVENSKLGRLGYKCPLQASTGDDPLAVSTTTTTRRLDPSVLSRPA